VIARNTLLAFVRKRVENSLQDVVKDHLDDWYRRTSKAAWKSSAQLKAEFGSASILSADRVVFNIKGNDFRLIALVDYQRQGVLILWIGTHREYDNIDAKEVRYDARRYFDLSDPRQ